MRLIDADKLVETIVNTPSEVAKIHTYNVLTSLAERQNEILDIVENSPTIEATPINNNPCGFCGKFNFGDAKAEVYRHGANIVIASALTRFPVEEQFNFCPVCGRFVKKGR